MTPRKKRIALAMSGGTDSTVAAILLLEQGYQVDGITLMTHSESAPFLAEATDLAKQLSIKHHIVDVRIEFNQLIVSYLLNEYQIGRTPNPCVRCNEKLKWMSVASKADKLGIKTIASGHYAKIVSLNAYHIAKGADPVKDQSYFLWSIPQQILKRLNFPLADLTKERVRQIASLHSFHQLAQKKESMGICFLNNQRIEQYLKQNLPEDYNKEGWIVTPEGQITGKHQGIVNYTLGQKKGLTLFEHTDYCVVGIKAEQNLLIASHPDTLFKNHIVLTQCVVPDQTLIQHDNTYQVRIRGIDQVPWHEASVVYSNETLHISFKKPVWAITPGQSVVVYYHNLIVGGGIVG